MVIFAQSLDEVKDRDVMPLPEVTEPGRAKIDSSAHTFNCHRENQNRDKFSENNFMFFI